MPVNRRINPDYPYGTIPPKYFQVIGDLTVAAGSSIRAGVDCTWPFGANNNGRVIVDFNSEDWSIYYQSCLFAVPLEFPSNMDLYGCSVEGINDHNIVCGRIKLSGTWYACTWNEYGNLRLLPRHSGETSSMAYDISNSGFMCGNCTIGGVAYPCRWSPSEELTILTYPAGFNAGYPKYINDAGVCTGVIYAGTTNFVVGKWLADGTAISLGRPSGSTRADPYGINNSNVISVLARGMPSYRACTVDASGTYTLKDIPAGGSNIGTGGINDLGDVCGNVTIGGLVYAVAWPHTGSYTVLPLAPGANSAYGLFILNNRVVVGTMAWGASWTSIHAYSWQI